MMKAVALALTLTGLSFASARNARADEFDKKLADSMTDRHIVQILTADESQILATPIASVVTVPTSSSAVGTTGVSETARTARELPKTASALPLLALAAIGSIGLAFGLMFVRRRVTAPAR